MTIWPLDAAESEAMWLSLRVSLVAVAVSLPFGIAVAWLLARKRFFGKMLLDTFVNMPLVLPPVVTGYLLLVLFARRGVLGGWLESWFGIHIVFSWVGAAVASAVVAFPLLVRPIRQAFLAVDPRLELAARTLGAGRWRTFRSVSLPLARGGVAAGAVLAFARAMGEFGATIMIAGSIPGETRTVPLHIYMLLESPGGADAAVPIIVASILIAAGALLAGEIIERRGRARLLGEAA
jgi:molybdate transport system permease protein